MFIKNGQSKKMNKKIQDTEEILQNALKAFQKITGLIADAGPASPVSDIRIRFRGTEQSYSVLVKKAGPLTHAAAALTVQNLKRIPQKILLIAEYVSPGLADLLRETDTPFLDTAGNAYLNDPPVFVFIKGNKPETLLRSYGQSRAFRTAGLKIIFALLCSPGLENAPFREIARAAAVSLGSVGAVMRELKQTGCLIDRGKHGRCLIRKENLLNRWITAYPELLRPKQETGRYSTADNRPWNTFDLLSFGAEWGGEPGAALMTGYLKPQILTIYAKQDIGKLLLKNKIRRDPRGNIEILKAFWNFEDTRGPLSEPAVHPLLIYADLIAAADPRTAETAKIIYEQTIIPFIRET
jgi:hypothetical protein